jgi:hypothetical protein
MACTPWRLVCTAPRLSSVSAYGRFLPLYAATPYTPSARAGSRLGLQRWNTRYFGKMVAVPGVEYPTSWMVLAQTARRSPH